MPKTVVLGDDEAGERISGFLPVVDAVLQEVQRPRAEKTEYIDRKNERTDLVIRVSRQHANRDAALRFLLAHPYEVPRRADVRIEHGTVRLNIIGAGLRPVRCVYWRGIHTVMEYTIRGGKAE